MSEHRELPEQPLPYTLQCLAMLGQVNFTARGAYPSTLRPNVHPCPTQSPWTTRPPWLANSFQLYVATSLAQTHDTAKPKTFGSQQGGLRRTACKTSVEQPHATACFFKKTSMQESLQMHCRTFCSVSRAACDTFAPTEYRLLRLLQFIFTCSLWMFMGRLDMPRQVAPYVEGSSRSSGFRCHVRAASQQPE